MLNKIKIPLNQIYIDIVCVYSPLAPVLLSVDLRNITQDRLLYRLSTYRLFLIGNFCDDPFIFIVKMLVKCAGNQRVNYIHVCVYRQYCQIIFFISLFFKIIAYLRELCEVLCYCVAIVKSEAIF